MQIRMKGAADANARIPEDEGQGARLAQKAKHAAISTRAQ
jgi:hypothetical protein